jgi:hypothetical protein
MPAPVLILTFTPLNYPNGHLCFSFGAVKWPSSNAIRTQIMLILSFLYFGIKAVIWRLLTGWQGSEFRRGTVSLFTACPPSRQSTHKVDLLNDRESSPKFEADRTCCWCNALKVRTSKLSDELSQAWYSCSLSLTHVIPRIFTFIWLGK